MTGRRGPSKENIISRNGMCIILILAGFVALISFGLGMSSPESYDFCTKLNNMDENTDTHTELKQQLQKMCGMKLDQKEQELGTLSVEFMENLSLFSASWKENETKAREYAGRIDRSHRKIKGMNMSTSEIPALIESLYVSVIDKLGVELQIQDNYITNIVYSIDQLEGKESDLTARWKRLNVKAEYKTGIEQNLSRIYSQRTIESNHLESNLGLLTREYERGKTSFKANVFPYIFIGIVLGGMIGFALGIKWKKEKSYWHAYSSSAKVASPLKLAALLTGALLAALLLYLFLSGIWDAIVAG